MVLRFLDAGESHGRCLLGIIEGFPQGVELNQEKIDYQLQRRQGGFGRGSRMKIEQDHLEILAGIIEGKSIGSPIGLLIKNKDWENNDPKNMNELTIPRPGHADLAGLIKYNLDNYRPILERASARNTAMRVAIGAIAQQLLEYFSIYSFSHVISIGNISVKNAILQKIKKENSVDSLTELKDKINKSAVFCVDDETSQGMVQKIKQAAEEGNSLGGQFEIIVRNVPIGLGSHVFWDRRIDSRIAGALMSIPSVKAVEIGEGIKSSKNKGSIAHDAIYFQKNKQNSNYYRKKNWAGGIEGGITNGENIVVRVYLKPIPTLLQPLPSVDIKTKKEIRADYQRSDICVVPAASAVGEAVVNWELATVFIEKFGNDSLREIENNFNNYLKRIQEC
ncbi:MAG: chorismate synthase [Atribacterota bacterium]|nr:chorismate synthase [Atribacterota bacterium]